MYDLQARYAGSRLLEFGSASALKLKHGSAFLRSHDANAFGSAVMDGVPARRGE